MDSGESGDRRRYVQCTGVLGAELFWGAPPPPQIRSCEMVVSAFPVWWSPLLFPAFPVDFLWFRCFPFFSPLLHTNSQCFSMPPFRNLLSRKPQPNALDTDGFDEAHLSPNGRPTPAPITMRRSCDGQQPPEYKLSGTSWAEMDVIIRVQYHIENELNTNMYGPIVVNDSGVYLPV